jgi:hypothetical protein
LVIQQPIARAKEARADHHDDGRDGGREEARVYVLVFPAASSPSISSLISLDPKILSIIFVIELPMLAGCCPFRCEYCRGDYAKETSANGDLFLRIRHRNSIARKAVDFEHQPDVRQAVWSCLVARGSSRGGGVVTGDLWNLVRSTEYLAVNSC